MLLYGSYHILVNCLIMQLNHLINFYELAMGAHNRVKLFWWRGVNFDRYFMWFLIFYLLLFGLLMLDWDYLMIGLVDVINFWLYILIYLSNIYSFIQISEISFWFFSCNWFSFFFLSNSYIIHSFAGFH
jgi:hypothetical protein